MSSNQPQTALSEDGQVILTYNDPHTIQKKKPATALDLMKFDRPPLIHLGNSKIVKGEKGLFANKIIRRGEPVIVYYGDMVKDADFVNMYMEDREKYFAVAPYIRGTPNDFAINGKSAYDLDNINLQGIYVNDAAKLNISPGSFDIGVAKRYAATSKQCNLRVVDTTDYPVYAAQKRIKKNEELTVHYGIGYWLEVNGFAADEISDLNKKYDFSSFYK